MRAFELVEPQSLAAACNVLAGSQDARAIAGGTALLTVIKQGLLTPSLLVNLHKVKEAREISFDQGSGIRIGALATLHEIDTSPLVREHCPLLADACHSVANIRIRNMATIGGNLAHGDHQSDPPTALTALDGRVELLSGRGRRELAVADFLLGSYENVLAPDELLAAVKIAPPSNTTKGAYIKFTTGSAGERPCAGVAAVVDADGYHCRELRLAVGAVSPKPARIDAGEALAKGRELTAPLVDRIAAEVASAIDPLDDSRTSGAYKRHLVAVLTRRAINACLDQRARGPVS